MISRPENQDTPEERSKKESEISAAFMAYLASTGEFADFRKHQDEYTQTMVSDAVN